MILENKTILITGGSSGIGLALCDALLKKGNKVIICGRSEKKLLEAKCKYPALYTYSVDLSSEKETTIWMTNMMKLHSECSILINNAALVHATQFTQDSKIIEKTRLELNTNLFAPILLSKLFLKDMEAHAVKHIVNITTGLIYAPKASYPIYNACKAALHSFSQTLRLQLKENNAKVTEVMMPAVNTPWHKGNAPKIAISAEKAVRLMLKGLEKEKQEIKIGAVQLLYWVSRIAPAFAIKKINRLR